MKAKKPKIVKNKRKLDEIQLGSFGNWAGKAKTAWSNLTQSMKSAGSQTSTDLRVQNIFIRDFVSAAITNLDNAVKSGLVTVPSNVPEPQVDDSGQMNLPLGQPGNANPTTESLTYLKLNQILESVIDYIDEQNSQAAPNSQNQAQNTYTLSNYLKNIWYPSYMTGVEIQPYELKYTQLINDVQNTWKKDKGRAALTNLARLSYAISVHKKKIRPTQASQDMPNTSAPAAAPAPAAPQQPSPANAQQPAPAAPQGNTNVSYNVSYGPSPTRQASAPATTPNRATAARTSQQTQQNLNNYVRGVSQQLSQVTDRNQKINLTKELVNFMADRKGYPEWNNALRTAEYVLKKNTDPKFATAAIQRLRAGQRMDLNPSGLKEEWKIALLTMLIEGAGLTWKDLGLSVLLESNSKKYKIVEY